jgi:hypothetical protein
VDTAIHFVLDENAEILIMIGSLFPQVATYPVASRNGHILEQAVSAFIADRAVMGMVHHKPFDHVPAEIDGLLIGRRHDHPVGDIHHTAHLYPFDGSFEKLHGAHPAGTDGPESLMVAEPRDDDPQPRRGLNDLRSRFDVYFDTVNL